MNRKCHGFVIPTPRDADHGVTKPWHLPLDFGTRPSEYRSTSGLRFPNREFVWRDITSDFRLRDAPARSESDPPRWRVGLTSIRASQLDQRDLGPSPQANRQPGHADAPADVDGADRPLHQALRVLLPEARRHHRR